MRYLVIITIIYFKLSPTTFYNSDDLESLIFQERSTILSLFYEIIVHNLSHSAVTCGR